MKTETLKSWRISLARKLLGTDGEITPVKRESGKSDGSDSKIAVTAPEIPDTHLIAADAKIILVVDDDAIIRKTTSMKLQAAGFRVITAVDGAEAIAIVGSQKPDIVLLDIDFPPDVAHGGVPSWDGFKLMNWLRGVTNGTRYIIATGVDSDAFESRALASGAAAFFRKPIDYIRLLEAIQNQLNGASVSPPGRRKPSFEI